MDWKDFLKPTKKKILVFFGLLLMHPVMFGFFMIFGSVLNALFGLAAAEFYAYGLFGGGVLFFAPIVLGYSIIFDSRYNLSWVAQSREVGLVLFFAVYGWLISCAVYSLASAAYKRFGSKGIFVVVAVWALCGSIFLFAILGFESDRGCKTDGCQYYLRGFSDIQFGPCEYGGYECVAICSDFGDSAALATPIENVGSHPITLKTVRVIAPNGESCSRSFDRYLKPGEKSNIVVREGCKYPGEGDVTIEFTYTKHIDGDEVQAVESGHIHVDDTCTSI